MGIVRLGHVPYVPAIVCVPTGRGMDIGLRLFCWFTRAGVGACTLGSGSFMCSEGQGHAPYVLACICVQVGRGMYLMFPLLCVFWRAGACTLCSGYCVCSERHGHVLYVSYVADPGSEFICAGCSRTAFWISSGAWVHISRVSLACPFGFFLGCIHISRVSYWEATVLLELELISVKLLLNIL